MLSTRAYAVVSCGRRLGQGLAFREAGPDDPPKPRLLDRVRAAASLRHTHVLNRHPSAVKSPIDTIFGA